MSTLLHTHTPDTPPNTTNAQILRTIDAHVNERGFYLYEWISASELRSSIESDYLEIVRSANIPLAIFTFIVGCIGLTGGSIGVIIGVLLVLGIFYLIVFVWLLVRMIQKARLYTRGADIVITDDHYVSGGRILAKSDFAGQQQAFRSMETIFREPLFGDSSLQEYTTFQRKDLLNQLKTIFDMGSDVIRSSANKNRNGGSIALVVLVVGVLYALMMAIVYFLGVFFVALFARIFAWIARKILILSHNDEYTIQYLFEKIHASSEALHEHTTHAISLLQDAQKNAWMDNLSGRIKDVFRDLNTSAESATNQSITLRHELENSRYHDIFHFTKYDRWIKTEVLNPIDEIIALLDKNKHIIEQSVQELDTSLAAPITDESGKKAMEMQKIRLKMETESIDRMLTLLDGYRKKLL